MHEKRTFTQWVDSFVSGKGFYIVLFACIAVIGVSAWVLLFSDYAVVSETRDYTDAVLQEHPAAELPVLAPEGEIFGETEVLEKAEEPAVEVMRPIKTPEKEPDVAPVKEPEPAPAPAPEAPPEGEPEQIVEEKAPASFIWPIAGDIAVGYFPDELVFNKTMGDWRTHDGVDIAAAIGSRVMAVSDGTVTGVYTDDLMGSTVVIDHGDGLTSVYQNLAATPTVSVGDSVAEGSVIGSVGDTAIAETGEVQHLHFSMAKDGVSVDPADYLGRR